MVCPSDNNLTVTGTEIKRAPRFRYRFACYLNGSAYDTYVNLWPSGSEGFKKWEAAAYADAHSGKNYATAKFACVQLFRLRMREGGEMCCCNHSLYGYYDRFLKTQPEWFAKGYPDGTPPQLCYTEPGLIEQVAQDAVDYFNGESTKIGLKEIPVGRKFLCHRADG